MGTFLPHRSFFIAVFLLLITFSRCVNSSLHLHPTPIPHDLYHSSNDLLKEIKAIAAQNPDNLSMETMKASNKGYDAEMLVITFNTQKNNVHDKSKLRVLLSFGQHARELITTEVALKLLSLLAQLPNMDSTSTHKDLDNIVIKVVPIENLNGRKLVEAGDLCERRNGRGVDLNRNWGVDWGKKEKDYNPYEEYPGKAPFSEPEAQIMRQLAISFRPHIWINMHSGMENRGQEIIPRESEKNYPQALFLPYDHKNTTPGGSLSIMMELVLREVNHIHFKDKCLVGSGGHLVGYLAHGTTTDYMYEVVKVPMTFTFEIYGDQKAPLKDCFKMFNPVDKRSFNETVNKWSAALITLFRRGLAQLGADGHFATSAEPRKWAPAGGKVVDRNSVGTGKKNMMDGLEVGLQDMRTYFRLFLLSSVLLLFMFCSRISKSKYRQTNST